MNDDNWDTISGPIAHGIEFINYVNQTNTIRTIFNFLAHFGGQGPGGCSVAPSSVHLRELHRAGTALLLHEPGRYRDTPVHVGKADGTVVYQPPPAADVEGHMREFFAELDRQWARLTPIQVGAYALWRINWIHPFKNGNGRTARAFAYTCICLKYGLLLPGQPTVIDQIMTDQQARDDYESSLRAADLASGPDATSALEQLLERLLRVQLTPAAPPQNPLAN